jgi:hypothetical protein
MMRKEPDEPARQANRKDPALPGASPVIPERTNDAVGYRTQGHGEPAAHIAPDHRTARRTGTGSPETKLRAEKTDNHKHGMRLHGDLQELPNQPFTTPDMMK